MTRSGKRRSQPAAKIERRTDARVVVLLCLALAAMVLICYWPVHTNGFINYDDNVYVLDNPHVLRGLNWGDLRWAFSTSYTGYPHPLTWVSHQLDYLCYGKWAGGHHLVSVAIHAINSVLLFLLWWRTTTAFWRSAFVAALFAVHPLHVESVAWIAERKDVLCGLFFLLTLHAYCSYARSRSMSHYLLSLGLFLAGILSKPMIVTLPVVLLLLDMWPLRRITALEWLPSRNLLFEKLPFVAISAGWSVITFVVQKNSGALAKMDHVGLLIRIGNAVVGYLTYLVQTLWPHDLALFYPYPEHVSIVTVLGAAVLLVVISALCIFKSKSASYLIVGWLWYLVMLLPVIGLIQAGAQAHADRYTYLPQIGLLFALIWGAFDLVTAFRFNRVVAASTGMAIVISLGCLTCRQTVLWHDSESVWRHALSVTANNVTAHVQMCDALIGQGRLNEAVAEGNAAVRLRSNSAEAHSNLAIALTRSGQNQLALQHFQEASAIDPARPKLHYNMATAFAEAGRLDDSIAEYKKELQLRPDFIEAYNNLGSALAAKGELDDALTQFKKAAKLDPRQPKVHYNMAVVLLRLGQPTAAVEELQRELQINPANPDAHYQLGTVLAQQGRLQDGVQEWETALRWQPTNLAARCGLAWLLATSPDDNVRNGARAVELAEAALQQTGQTDPRVYRLVAAAYAENNDFNRAEEAARRGSQLAMDQGHPDVAEALQADLVLYQQRTKLRSGNH